MIFLSMRKVRQTITEKHAAKLNRINTKLSSWIVDSGATSHTSSSKDFFKEFSAQKGGRVRLADHNKVVKVHGIGSGTVKCVVNSGKVFEVKVLDLLHVSSLGSNLREENDKRKIYRDFRRKGL